MKGLLFYIHWLHCTLSQAEAKEEESKVLHAREPMRRAEKKSREQKHTLAALNYCNNNSPSEYRAKRRDKIMHFVKAA